MASAGRSAVAPLYLVACLILGGSAQGIWQNALLQLTGLAIIAWVVITPLGGQPVPASVRTLFWLAIAAVALIILQGIPLPASIWEHGVRARILDGYRLLGRPLPAMSASLTPYESASALLCLIPPLAVFGAVIRVEPGRRS